MDAIMLKRNVEDIRKARLMAAVAAILAKAARDLEAGARKRVMKEDSSQQVPEFLNLMVGIDPLPVVAMEVAKEVWERVAKREAA
jgi:hypothetical protein